MTEAYHPVTAQIVSLLQTHQCWHETFTHEAVRTSEEAARTRPGYSLQQGAKAIIVRIKKSNQDKSFVMLVFPADRAFDSRKVKTYFQAKDIRFATEDEVAELTNGVQVGGVPPFGNLFGLPVYAAPELFDQEKIVFNAGDRRFSVAMTSADYRTLVQPVVADIL
jgi:prolyl-tRNA editing enzyme YbaK/EbsC (Cys-tRNA(Pro) deacylase)